MTIRGPDLSHYQQADLAQVAASGHPFVILKATEGAGYVDPTFAARRQQAHAAGLLVGIYHFARAGNATGEAAFFLRTVGTLQANEFLALDWEVSYSNPPAWCQQWLDTVRQASGVAPLIYMNQSALNGSNWSGIAATYGLWLARYDGSLAFPSVPYWGTPAMKQFTDAGPMPGVGTCDVNVFNGSVQQLAAYCKGGTSQEEDVPLTGDDVNNIWRSPLLENQGVPILRLMEMDATLGAVSQKVDGLAASVAQLQTGATPTIDEAKLAAALLADPKNVDALGAAIAAHLQLAPRPAAPSA